MSQKPTHLNLEIESDSFSESDKPCLSFDFSVSLLPVASSPQISSLLTTTKSETTPTPNPFDTTEGNVAVHEMPDESDDEEGEFGVMIKKPAKEEKPVEVEDISEDKPKETEEKEKGVGPIDLLEVTFNNTNELPEEVCRHIESKIGMFQKNANEEEGTVTLTFEVNFHQINKQEIWESYLHFFEQSANPSSPNMKFELSLQKNGSLDDLFESFKKDPEIPLVLHLMENSRLKFESKGPDYLLKTGMNYMKPHMKTEMALLEFLLCRFKGLSGKVKLGALSDISKDFWQRMELDQTQNFGGFFDVWRTPLLKHVFGNGEGVLKVRGTVFNFFEYEFNMQIVDFEKFLGQIKQQFK